MRGVESMDDKDEGIRVLLRLAKLTWGTRCR